MLISSNNLKKEKKNSIENNDDYEEINKDITRILIEMNIQDMQERLKQNKNDLNNNTNNKFVEKKNLYNEKDLNFLNYNTKNFSYLNNMNYNHNSVNNNYQNLNQTYDNFSNKNLSFYNEKLLNNNLIEESNIKKNQNKIIQIENKKKENIKKLNLDSPKNLIHLENILKLKDKRTTLIIRNIPNKYTIKLLTKEINQHFYGKFDVIYLPLDYINKTNLGYGFINFIDPIHIIYFYDEFIGKKWNNFNSNKKCNLAYAKIQGKNEILKYIYKKNNTNIITSIGSNNHIFYLENCQIICNEIEIPLKYYISFINYYPYSVCHKKNEQVFVVDKYFEI